MDEDKFKGCEHEYGRRQSVRIAVGTLPGVMKCRSVRSISYFLLLAFLAFIVFTQNVAALEFYKNESNATTSATGTTALEKLSLTLNKLVANTDAIIKSIFGASPRASETIEIRDSKSTPVLSDIKTYDENKQQKKMGKKSSLSVADIPDKGELEVDAIASKNVGVKFKVNTASRGEVILDDLGKNNPVSVPLPGRIVKYLEIGARNISFSSADVTIRYSDAELNGGNEYDLAIYHWNGASWDALPTTVDIVNKTLSAVTTSLSPFGVATSFIYYLENNNTIQSLGADGNTEYSASGTTVMLSTRPYVNLLKNGTMGTNANIRFTTTSPTTEYELFRFYQPFNYTMDTRISANSTFNISWLAANANNRLNVSLIDYNPATGEKKIIGKMNFTATGGAAQTTYGYQINHSAYTIPKGNRLMFRINTTTPTRGTVRLYFNSYISNITVNETQIGGGVNLTSISALTNTTLAGTNSTYFLNLTNNGTASDTYVITVSNPNGASIFAANITPVTLDAGASKVFNLNVTNTSANATSFHVNVTATALNSSQSGYINTTTTVIAARVNLTNISALSNTTLAGTNSTYYLNLINNGTAPDTYIIITSNPDNAAIATTNITSVTLGAGAGKVFALDVTNTSSGAFKVNVTATSTNDATKFAYVNTTTTVSAVRAVSLSVNPSAQETSAGINATYILNLTNEGSETDTYNITSSNPDNAAIAGTNLTSVTLGAGASKVFNLNVNNPYQGDFRINVTATSETDPTGSGYINTTTTVIAFATSFIYYLENNNTIQSLGADGNTEYSASGTTITLSTRPYVNLLKNGTMGTNANIRFTTTSRTIEYELFRFYQPFNYTMDTRISANSTFNISWLAANANNRLNVSLIDYNPATGEKKIIGIRNFTAGGTTQQTYSYQINHSAYIIPKGNRLMFRINTTTPTTGNVRLYFNSYISNITVKETQIGGGVNLTSSSALSNTTPAGTNSTYFLKLTNNGTAPDTYNISVSNPDYAVTAATNITNSFTLNAGASKVFTLNVTNTSSGTFRVNVTATARNSSQFGHINTTTAVTDITAPAPNITSWGNNNTNNLTLFFNVPVFTEVFFNVTSNQTITTYIWTYDNTDQNQNFTDFTKLFVEPGRHYVNVLVTNNNGTDYNNWTVMVNPESWESYNDSTHIHVNNNFIAGQQTVYMFGTGFGTNYSYKVAYYDGNNTKRSTEAAIYTDSAGNLSSSYIFASGSDAAGTWHTQVFNASISPPDTYDAANPDVIADDSFSVDITAIPEFPAGIVLPFAASLILYAFMRKKYAKK